MSLSLRPVPFDPANDNIRRPRQRRLAQDVMCRKIRPMSLACKR